MIAKLWAYLLYFRLDGHILGIITSLWACWQHFGHDCYTVGMFAIFGPNFGHDCGSKVDTTTSGSFELMCLRYDNEEVNIRINTKRVVAALSSFTWFGPLPHYGHVCDILGMFVKLLACLSICPLCSNYAKNMANIFQR